MEARAPSPAHLAITIHATRFIAKKRADDSRAQRTEQDMQDE
jgi:hypothetical protein